MLILIPFMEHPLAEELQQIAGILDENPIISEMAWQHLTRVVQTQGAGAHEMNAERALPAAIV